MRKIKFRVWDKKDKKMRQLINIVFNTGFYLEPNDNTLKLIWVKGYNIIEQKDVQMQREKDFKLMQYTGLHDKNGKEIYEGDIVLYFSKYTYMVCFGGYNKNPSNCAKAIIVGFYLKEINTGEIEELYSINKYGAKFPAHCAESEQGAENFKLEVIGNVYENRDLLKDY